MIRRLFQLFAAFFRLSLFVVGGGYAILTVADSVFARLKWTEEGELVDRLPVFQTLPGLIATHTAIYVGRKVAGLRGALVAVFAVALPSIVIFTLVSAGYDRLPLTHPLIVSTGIGLRAALTGIIASTVIRSWKKAKKDAFYSALVVTGVCLVALAGVPVPLVILGGMALGLGIEYAPEPRSKRFGVQLWPFLLFLKYGALGFGGGFVLVPMYLQDFVGPQAPFLNLTQEAFANVMALSQATPGPIGINCATFFGFHFGGIPGALVASVFLLLPGSALAYFAFRSLEKFGASRVVIGLMRGVRPVSQALMLVALVSFVRTSCASPEGVCLTVLSFALISRKLLGAMATIGVSGAIGLACGALRMS